MSLHSSLYFHVLSRHINPYTRSIYILVTQIHKKFSDTESRFLIHRPATSLQQGHSRPLDNYLGLALGINASTRIERIRTAERNAYLADCSRTPPKSTGPNGLSNPGLLPRIFVQSVIGTFILPCYLDCLSSIFGHHCHWLNPPRWIMAFSFYLDTCFPFALHQLDHRLSFTMSCGTSQVCRSLRVLFPFE